MAELRDKMLAEGILVGVLSKYLDNKPTYYRFCQVIIGYIYIYDYIRDYLDDKPTYYRFCQVIVGHILVVTFVIAFVITFVITLVIT